MQEKFNRKWMNPDNTNYPGWKKPNFRIMYCSDVVGVVETESRKEGSRKVGEEGMGSSYIMSPESLPEKSKSSVDR